ncbi:hypothetical protein E8F06_09935 [Pseudomonas sp. BN411]|nr:hypothetical protein [Pseudomonas sp. BN411]MDH4656998.1 hypothetical protein [Pseudomonas sp. BN606]
MAMIPASTKDQGPHNRDALEPNQIYLIASRLQPPVDARNLVARAKLSSLVLSGAHKTLTLVSSPAGYGKTCLLAELQQELQKSGMQTAWLSITPLDQSLPVFSAYLRAAIELASNVDQIHGPISRVGSNTLSEAFNRTMALIEASEESPLYLFLDDVHHLAGTDSVRLLSMLIDHTPQGVRFVLSFRGEPCLSVARHRMHGKVTDFTSQDLRFEENETTALLAADAVTAITPEDIRSLVQRLEGWAGGLKLAALLLKRTPELIQDLKNFSGERRQFADFFLQDVLADQPNDVQEFLILTSILSTLNASTCNFLTKRTDAQQKLLQCLSQGLFLLPLDGENRDFRLHPLFSEFLYRTLLERYSDRVSELHISASRVLENTGNFNEAFSHAIQAQDDLRAAEIMNSHLEEIFDAKEEALALVKKIPMDTMMEYPKIVMAHVWKLLTLWQFETCKRLLSTLRQRLDEKERKNGINEESRELRLIFHHREMMLSLLSDNLENVEESAQYLIDNYHDAHPLLKGSLYSSLMYARRERFKFDDMERLNSLALEYFSNFERGLTDIYHQAMIGPSRFVAGQTRRAIDELNVALQLAEKIDGKGSPLAALIAMHLAKIHYELDDLEQSRELLSQYLPSASQRGFVDQAIAGWLTAARLAMIDGKPTKAFSLLDEADAFAAKHQFDRLKFFSLAERLKLLLRRGEIDDVIRLGKKHGLRGEPAATVAPHATSRSRDEARALAWTRVAQAEDRIPEAIGLAKQWHRYLNGRDAVRSCLRWELVIAHLLLLSGDKRAAQRTLREALSTAEPGGFIRLFLDEGAWLEGLLKEQLESTPTSEKTGDAFALTVLEHMGGSPSQAAKLTAEDVPVIGAFNTREMEILLMVSAGMLNREIGNRLGMTEGSVKWYLQQIYDKLGIRRRSQAVERARQLGIIQ